MTVGPIGSTPTCSGSSGKSERVQLTRLQSAPLLAAADGVSWLCSASNETVEKGQVGYFRRKTTFEIKGLMCTDCSDFGVFRQSQQECAARFSKGRRQHACLLLPLSLEVEWVSAVQSRQKRRHTMAEATLVERAYTTILEHRDDQSMVWSLRTGCNQGEGRRSRPEAVPTRRGGGQGAALRKRCARTPSYATIQGGG